MSLDEERSAEALVRHAAEAAGTVVPCPDADVVAGFAEGRLAEDDRAAVVRHLSACAPCRALVAAMCDAGIGAEVGTSAPSGRVRRFPWRAAVAAVLVATVSVVAWRVAGDRNAPPTEERLVAAAGALRASHPRVFGEFRPLSADELRGGAVAVERGGVAVLAPRGALLDGRPGFAWEALPGAERYTLRVRADDGRTLLERTVTAAELPYPADAEPIAPGTKFVWRVVAAGPWGEAAGSASARVLDSSESLRFAQGRLAITKEAPERLRAVLSAQWALSAGLLAEAHASLDVPPPAGGWTEIERETRAHVRRRLGLASEDAPR